MEAISYMGYKDCTPIQKAAMPMILDGHDLIACAQTGTGKTAAFLLPILHKMAQKPADGVNTLIVVPTRELAIQIDQAIQGFAYYVGVESICIYGGGDGGGWDQQKQSLMGGTPIIVATPGKLISHLNLGYVKFDKIQHFILDEADRMLDIGFHDDIIKIMTHLPKKRQNLMFSATMPPKIRSFAKKILTDPKEISLSISKPAAGVLQAAYLAHDNQKTALIASLIVDKPEYKSIIVFCSTKKKVSELVRDLKRKESSVAAISSDLEQADRENVLLDFRSKRTRVVVATDVLSRGIDIKDINLVINFDVPDDGEDYVHRIGRTARADTTGAAITLVNEEDMYKFQRIEHMIEKEVIKINVPTELGESPKWDPTFRKKKPMRKNFRRK